MQNASNPVDLDGFRGKLVAKKDVKTRRNLADLKKCQGFDEAATTVHNCYINKWGPDRPITCEKGNFNDKWAYGHWSYSVNIPGFSEGPCYNFINWKSGQGLPDMERIDNPYNFLAYLESRGVDISRVE